MTRIEQGIKGLAEGLSGLYPELVKKTVDMSSLSEEDKEDLSEDLLNARARAFLDGKLKKGPPRTYLAEQRY